MIQHLHLHPVSIAILEREYRDHIVDGVLVLDKCIHLKDQIRGARNNSKTRYPDYIKIRVTQKIDDAQLRRAGHFLYRDAMHRLTTFIELVSSYGKLNAKEALFQFYEFYDIDPYEFNYETGQKIWTRSRQNRPEVAEILKKYKSQILDYNHEAFHDQYDAAAMAILPYLFTRASNDKVFVPVQLRYHVLKYRFGLPIHKIAALTCTSRSSVCKYLIRFRHFLLRHPDARKALDAVVPR